MALNIKLIARTSDNCKNLIIEEVTGKMKSPTDNPEGWGLLNQTSFLSHDSVDVFVTAYHFINNVQYTTTFQVVDILYYISFPFVNSIEGFKVSLPSDVISTYIANQILLESNVDLPEEYDVTQETLEDNIYEVRVRINIPEGDSIISNSVKYSSICNMKNKVESLLSSIDLSCKDCNQLDFDKALLAKSILEGLEND
jgi:hypothetical protein